MVISFLKGLKRTSIILSHHALIKKELKEKYGPGANITADLIRSLYRLNNLEEEYINYSYMYFLPEDQSKLLLKNEWEEIRNEIVDLYKPGNCDNPTLRY